MEWWRGGITWPNPPVELAILMVARAVRSMASRQASAGGHFSLSSVKTDVAARTVKSTSSMVCRSQWQDSCNTAAQKKKRSPKETYQTAPHDWGVPNRVEIGDARHENVMRCQIRVVQHTGQVQLPVQPHDPLPCLRDLQIHPILVLAQLGARQAGASDVHGRVVLSFEHSRHAEALSIEHHDGLPVVEVEEFGGEAHARVFSRRRVVLPLVQPLVDVYAPRPEGFEFGEEWRGKAGVHVLILQVLPRCSRTLGLLVLQDLQDLGLQQPESEVVMGDEFGCGLRSREVGGRLFETVWCDKDILQDGWEFCGYDLVRNTKRPAHTDTDESVE